MALALACVAVLVLLGGVCVLRAGDAPPWPADVPGFTAPEPGEHPRLLFRRTDLPALRKRAETAEGKALIARLEALLGEGMDALLLDGEKESAGKHTVSHVAGHGFLYQLTGNRKYADKGRRAMEMSMEGMPDVDERYAWRAPNGALRTGPSLGWHALGYDLCYDGWDEGFRRKVALAIQNYNAGPYCSLEELVKGSRHFPGSNHWGMQVGGGALAVLAIRGDPGVDRARIEALVEASAKSMIRNLTEGFGDHGSFAEGDGTGVMSSHIVFLPALQAWRVAAGKDFCSPRPNARWTCLKFVNWPFGMREENPSKVLPRLVVDEWSGRCMFRNRWQDGDDCIVDAQLEGTKGWMGSGGGLIHVWGLGRQSRFPMQMKGDATVIEPADYGGVVSIAGQSLGVDFSGLAGADALVVMVGTGEAAPLPGEAVKIEAGGHGFTIMLLAKEKTPELKADGGKVVVGKRTIAYDGKKIVFGEP